MDDIRKTFQKFDTDGNGFISYSEAHQVLNQELGFSPERTKTLLQVYDRNNDGRLSYEEFIWFYWKIQERKEDMLRIFTKFDTGGRREMTFTEAHAALKGLHFTDQQVHDLFRIHDKNRDGRLQYEEFLHFWGACGGSVPTAPI